MYKNVEFDDLCKLTAEGSAHFGNLLELRKPKSQAQLSFIE